MSSFAVYKHKKFDRLRDLASRSVQGVTEEVAKSPQGKENMRKSIERIETVAASASASSSSQRKSIEETVAMDCGSSKAAVDNRSIVTRRMAFQKRNQTEYAEVEQQRERQ